MQTMQTMQIPTATRQNDEILELIDQRSISFPVTCLYINIGQSATYKLIRPDIASPFREPE